MTDQIWSRRPPKPDNSSFYLKYVKAIEEDGPHVYPPNDEERVPDGNPFHIESTRTPVVVEHSIVDHDVNAFVDAKDWVEEYVHSILPSASFDQYNLLPLRDADIVYSHEMYIQPEHPDNVCFEINH